MSNTDSWESFLNTEETLGRLLSTSIFITAFELLKSSIIGRIKDFYTIDGTDFEYKNKVLSLNKKPLYASLKWLENQGAITQHDLGIFEEIRKLRNQLAHELPQFVLGGQKLDVQVTMHDALSLLQKIEVWWIVNIEIPTDTEYSAGSKIDESTITPGPVLMMQMMFQVISGDTELIKHYRNSRRP